MKTVAYLELQVNFLICVLCISSSICIYVCMFLSVYYCEKVFHICFKAVYPVLLLLTDLKKLRRKALCTEKVLSIFVLSSVLKV